MAEIVLASHNPKKIEELRRILARELPDLVFLSLADVGVTGEIPEDGASYEENAIIKASVPARLGYIGIADDSGLSVDALDGAPGIRSARFAGEGGTPAEYRAKLLRVMEDVPDGDRTARFVSVMALCLPEGSEIRVPERLAISEKLAGISRRPRELTLTVRGECRGRITREEIGEGGFGYDCVFFSDELGETFAEATPEKKDSVSHRGRSLRAFSAAVKEVFEGEKNC